MCTPAKLRIILDEQKVHKLVLPSGIPSTQQDLTAIIKAKFNIPGDFSLMYQDKEFDGEFFTLSSIEDVQDMGTLKVIQTAPIILNLSAVEESDVCSSVQEESDSRSSTSFTSQDTILLSSSEDGSTSCRSQPWPKKFEIPTFSFDVEFVLETGNKAYQRDGTLLNDPKVISSILEKLAETIFHFTAYPTGIQVLNVVEALVDKFPCLKEPGSFNGMYGWQQRIKYKMGNYRTKLRGRQVACPELEVNCFKRKANDEPHLKGIKKPKKAEVNYLPPFPFGETEDTLEDERVNLLHESKKKENIRVVGEKMEKTFSYRRLEIVKHSPAVPDVIKRWPALFFESQVKDEFRRITTVHLERTFLTKLDLYTPRLLTIFKMKGGVAGTKIRYLLESPNQQLEGRRDAVIRCLVYFLGESCDELITEYQHVSKDTIKDSFAELSMKIIVLVVLLKVLHWMM